MEIKKQIKKIGLFSLYFLIILVSIAGVMADFLITKEATFPSAIAFLSCAEDSSTNKIYCFGGKIPSSQNKIFEYNPLIDTLITKSATLPSVLSDTSCVENSNTHKIYCFGGYGTDTLTRITEYNPLNDTLITKSATFPSKRYRLSCAEDSSTNKIYCFGGYGDYGHLNEILEYNPLNDTLITKNATLPTARNYLSCAENLNTHKIYCLGGQDSSGNVDEVIEYNPSTDNLIVKNATFSTGGRAFLSCAKNSNNYNIYCFGGTNSSLLDEIVEYNSSSDNLVVKNATLPSARYFLSCVENSNDNTIYCFGGLNDSYINEIIVYDIREPECSVNTDCGLCEKCFNYICINQTSIEDLKDECSENLTFCFNNYIRQGADGFCDGFGSCDIDDNLLNVSEGNVCYNGNDINPSNITNCDIWINCIENEINASKYYVGYAGNGTNICIGTGWIFTGNYWFAPHDNYINKTSIELLSCSYKAYDTTPPTIDFINPLDDGKSKFYLNELNNVSINFYDLNLKDYIIEFIYWENYLNQSIEFNYSNLNITETYYNFSDIFYTLKEGKWKLNITSNDNENNTINKIVNFEVIELKEGHSIFDFDLTNQINVILLFVILFAYIGLMAIAFSFKNFGFVSMGFIVGIFLGLLLSGVHIILTILFILVNILIFAKYASSFD